MKINSDIIRSAYIGNYIKNIIDEKGFTISDVANKIGIQQPALSRVLNGKVGGSNNFFIKVGNNIGLSTKQIEEIFKKADKEEYKYKYGEDLEIIPNGDINTLEDLDFENADLLGVVFKREFGKPISEEDKREIMNFIKYKAGK